MKKATVMLSLLLVLLTVGCARNIKMEMNGLPAPDNVVQANIFSPQLKLSMAFVRYYEVPEGDEVLDTFEYLPFQRSIPLTIDSDGIKSLAFTVQIRNPMMEDYQMWLESVNRDYGTNRLVRRYQPVYRGNLSRKEMQVVLPTEPGVAVLARLFLYDAEGRIIYMSPIADYAVSRSIVDDSVFESKAK